MRSLGGGGHSGGGRSFGGGSSGNRSFGGFRAGGSGRTRRVGSPGGGNSSVSGGSSSGGGFNFGDAISIAFILLELFGPFGALLAGGIILSVYMFTVSTFAGLVTTAISVAAVVFCLVYKKKAARHPLDITFVDEYAEDRKYNKDILYSQEFEAYLLEELRRSKILDKKNRIAEGEMYRIRESFDRIYKEYTGIRR